jgi:RNA polymerase sigma factor (sigma-70 family)
VTDDEALIRAAQAGDAMAFEQLLERHYETLYRFAYKWCGNRADAEDVTQQACLKLVRALASYRFESAFTSWLYRLVINCAKDWARHEGRHAGEDLDENRQAEGCRSAGNTVEHLVYLWQLLHKLDSLPEGLKETLLLVHGEGLTHSEAAQVLEIKDSTVSWRLHEFRKHYRLSLNEGGLCE